MGCGRSQVVTVPWRTSVFGAVLLDNFSVKANGFWLVRTYRE